MHKNMQDESADFLFDAILSLKDREECRAFFESLCTVNELHSMAQRLQVAAMLKNHNTYLEIADKTGVSTATISRVNRLILYGNDGLEIVLRRASAQMSDDASADL